MLYFPIGAPERLISRDRRKPKAKKTTGTGKITQRAFDCGNIVTYPEPICQRQQLHQLQNQEFSPVTAIAIQIPGSRSSSGGHPFRETRRCSRSTALTAEGDSVYSDTHSGTSSGHHSGPGSYSGPHSGSIGREVEPQGMQSQMTAEDTGFSTNTSGPAAPSSSSAGSATPRVAPLTGRPSLDLHHHNPIPQTQTRRGTQAPTESVSPRESASSGTAESEVLDHYDSFHHHSQFQPQSSWSTSQIHSLPSPNRPPISTANTLLAKAHHDNAAAFADTATDLLTLADFSTELSHVKLARDNTRLSIATPSSCSSYSYCSSISSSPSSSSSRYNRRVPLPPAPSPPQLQQQITATSTVRKTAPGLAARLKALGIRGGLDSISSSSSTSLSSLYTPHDHIGRLDQDQLRQLDERHHTTSFDSTVPKRGRPWRGHNVTLSNTDFSVFTSSLSASVPVPGATSESDSDPKLPELPQLHRDIEIDLLDVGTKVKRAMDTQKYQLPDYVNGNGTKSTIHRRYEHLERGPQSLADHDDEDDDDTPPTPPPKETPPAVTPPARSGDYAPGLATYFTPGRNRPGSIYTLSRASFANQLAQLTSLQLPDAELLSSQVSAIPTAQLASNALINAADQIKSWISKASEVIGGLDSDDDAEWSAAGGREGLAEVESAIHRFEELINVYVGAIEELQGRSDIANVSSLDLKLAVSQMETILSEWAKIRSTLNSVRGQVEIAMEWEELWNNVLGDIQGEMDELSRLVFEMEERRHRSITTGTGGECVDIGDLETIVEDTDSEPPRLQAPNRLNVPAFPLSPGSPSFPGAPTLSQDDSSLLALFARMQPLRASLDFLPMRLSVFQNRAKSSFPTACDELEMRRNGLDAIYKKLEKDAESLRKELGEDRWVIVFRGAGRQAQKMHESVERSLIKLQEAVEAGLRVTNPPAIMKKLESYEAKKTHYGPAIERVLSIIDRGVKDRLTVNGEILRLHADMEAKWNILKANIKEMDATVDQLQMDKRGQQLRDSISSMLSNDRSTLDSGQGTPGSSPPSSVIMTSLGFEPYTPAKLPKTRSSSTHSNIHSSARRQSSLPAPTGTNRNPSNSRLAPTSCVANQPPRSGSSLDHRPRWNTSVNTSDLDTGHGPKTLSITTPSPYSKRTPGTQRSVSSLTPSSAGSRLPQLRSPLSRAFSESPRAEETPTRSGTSRLSFRERLTSPGHGHSLLSKPRLLSKASMSSLTSGRRASLQPSRAPSAAGNHDNPSRPASSLATGFRRTSLPQSRSILGSTTGRDSPQPRSASRIAMRGKAPEGQGAKPKWRP